MLDSSDAAGFQARLRPSVGFAVIETGGRLLRALTRLMRTSELSLTQFYALTVIGDAPGTTQAQLAESLAIDAPRAVVIVDSLEKLGLAQRRPSQQDRRVRTLRLTPKGRRVAEEVVRTSLEFEKALTQDLSIDKQHTFLSLLSRLKVD